MALLLPQDIIGLLARAASPERAAFQAKLCNAEPGGYGEGDVFIGVTVPVQRAIAKQYWQLPLGPLSALLASEVHEHRLTGLLILAERYVRDPESRLQTYEFAYEHRSAASNWDLTDSLGPGVFGEHLLNRPRKMLHDLARSQSVWDRRLSLVSTLPLIRARQYADTLVLAEKLLSDPHELIHEASGWMLREVGKKDAAALRGFLRAHSHEMARVALRYAIEQLPEAERKEWLSRSKVAAKSGTALHKPQPPTPRTHGALHARVSAKK